MLSDFTLSLLLNDISSGIPYAIYGHSMGALVGYQLCRSIENSGLPLPSHLFCSGRQAPSIPIKEEDKNFHLLPRHHFIEKVMEYGGMPREVAAEKDLMDLFIPVLKADFQAVDNYNYVDLPPLDVPLTVLIGESEKTTYEDALKWQDVTSYNIGIKTFPGDHFFIFNHIPEIGRIISAALLR
ncbi:Thioesterase (fragment) [Desulfamplus magnetovallimortis]|uniref:Thioesterase n=2 Tax=Desulfamplus magnetovallimortis TaxID=1246637 RepID=A0A1W1HKX0_9BACT